MHMKHMSALLFLSYLAMSTATIENSGLHSANDVEAGYRSDRQFRNGRSVLPQRSREDDSLTELGVPSHSPVYSAILYLNPDETLSRERRQFYRFGRNHYPFLDESSLSSPNDGGSYITNSQDESESESYKKPRNRNRRFSNNGSQSNRLLHNNVKSDKSLQISKTLTNHVAGLKTQIQDSSETGVAIGLGGRRTANQDENNGSDRRFSRFSNRFRRFGHDDNERINNGPTRLGQQLDSQNDLDKRFMRFGRGYEDDENNNKRFMRFGKSTGYHANDEKRFMRFGKSTGYHANDEKRFMRFGKSTGYHANDEKRFMRFGKSTGYHANDEKRFMRFGKSTGYHANDEKRFMRFGKSTGYHANDEKRFMRFGKRFMMFGKRFMRFGRKDHDNDFKYMTGDRDLGSVDVAQLGSTIR